MIQPRSRSAPALAKAAEANHRVEFPLAVRDHDCVRRVDDDSNPWLLEREGEARAQLTPIYLELANCLGGRFGLGVDCFLRQFYCVGSLLTASDAQGQRLPQTVRP